MVRVLLKLSTGTRSSHTEARMKLVFLLAVLSHVSVTIRASATVEFKFVSFENRDHEELDGDCCDDIIGGCDDFCDNRFIVCLDKDTSGPDLTLCDIAHISTERVYDNNDDFSFPSTIPNGIPNPKGTTVPTWSGGMKIILQVWDVDGNADDKVDEDDRIINQAADRTLSNAVWREYTLGQQSVFKFQVRVYCNNNYYNTDCNVYCVAMDNQNGHYSCDPASGAKICYSGWEGANCDVDKDECQSNPCANGACNNGANRYTCSCDNGWTGKNCDVNIDDCASSPCKNNGICNDHVASFSCSCLPGHVYADAFCEYDDCAGQPCQNDATCVDLIGHFQCLCPQGYFGDLCEVDIDYCINQTCANNGTCVDRIDGFHCLCAMGYEGVMCDVETDECASDPCMYNSTCQDLIAGYSCMCQEGYEGTYCELETDECQSFPCKNNATCVDEVAGYQCHCAAGFEGDACQIDIDECASFPCYANETCEDEVNGYRCLRVNQCDFSPCLNNATCLDDYPGFICTCPAGYGGKTCGDDIDECASSPCHHQSTCVDHLNGFSCLCQPGYAGVTCLSENDECLSDPCVNGTCIDLIDGFVCNCSTGYSGLMCQIDTDECASSPCEHGRCVDELNGYTCECTVQCDQGYCGDDGQCHCDDGYEGEDCSEQTDYCLSSPCSKGTCVPLLNGYRCDCDKFHTGTHCENLVDDPCSLKPCKNGVCENTNNVVEYNYQCNCDENFYGKNCEIDITLYGAVVMVTGKLENALDFESKMASLLQKLLQQNNVYAKSETGTVSVKVILEEDYVKSSDSTALTKVTFVAWTESGYLTKGFIENLIDSASSELLAELGYEVYQGDAKPVAQTDNQSWIGAHWYVVLLIILVVAAVAVGGFLVWRKSLIIYKKGSYNERPRENGLPSLDPPDAGYCTRITGDFTNITDTTRLARANTVESINPAYIPTCEEPDVGFGCTEDFFGATGGAGARASNLYAEIPPLKAAAVASENPYSEIKK